MKRAALYLFLFSGFLTYILFLPYSNHLSSQLPNAIDPVFYAWNIDHNTQSILSDGKNLLNTNIFYPEQNTLAFSDTLYAQTLFSAPILLLTKNLVLTENLYVLLTFPLSALTMFFLLYFLTKQTVPSALSGIFYAFCIPRIAQIGHMPAISSQWIPLFILFLLKYFQSGKVKYFLLTFLAYLLNITSSMYFGVFLIPVTIVCSFIQILLWTKNKTLYRIKTLFKHLGIFIIPMGIILILLLFPYIRLKAEMPQIKRGLEDTSRLSAVLTNYKTVLPTNVIARFGMTTLVNERPLYPTMILLVTAVLGIVFGWKRYRKFVLLFLFIGFSSFILSFGPYQDIAIGKFRNPLFPMPYTFVYSMLPVLQIIRVPARLSILVILSLSALAGLGLSTILTSKKRIVYGIVILSVFLFEIWQTNTPSVHIPTAKEIPLVYAWLSKEPQSSIIVELPLRPLWRGLSMEDQLMKQYKETKDEDVFTSETYRVYFSTIHKKRMINGYSGFFPQIYHDQAGLLDNFPSQESIQMLEQNYIRYIIIHAWQYTDKTFTTIQNKITLYPNIQFVKQFDDDYVYEIISK